MNKTRQKIFKIKHRKRHGVVESPTLSCINGLDICMCVCVCVDSKQIRVSSNIGVLDVGSSCCCYAS